MTLVALSKTLPNGFHDAELNAVRLEFATNSIILDITLDVTPNGDFDAGLLYRRAIITLTGVRGVIFRIPEGENQRFLGALDVSGQAVTNYQGLPDGMRSEDIRDLLYSFYIDDWNSSLYLAAERAELSWIEGPPDQGGNWGG